MSFFTYERAFENLHLSRRALCVEKPPANGPGDRPGIRTCAPSPGTNSYARSARLPVEPVVAVPVRHPSLGKDTGRSVLWRQNPLMWMIPCKSLQKRRLQDQKFSEIPRFLRVAVRRTAARRLSDAGMSHSCLDCRVWGQVFRIDPIFRTCRAMIVNY